MAPAKSSSPPWTATAPRTASTWSSPPPWWTPWGATARLARVIRTPSDLPLLLRWFSANIGIHHVHHLNSRIPYYRLPKVLRDHPELKAIGRLTLRDSLKGIPLSLWCERREKLVSFRSALPH